VPNYRTFEKICGSDEPNQRGLNTKRSTLVFFWVPRNLSHHMIRQALIGDTVLAKRIEMTGKTQTLPWWLGGEKG
jgi:hypothetical protein